MQNGARTRKFHLCTTYAEQSTLPCYSISHMNMQEMLATPGMCATHLNNLAAMGKGWRQRKLRQDMGLLSYIGRALCRTNAHCAHVGHAG